MTGWYWHVLPIALGFFLDLLLGDPAWLYHPVRLIGHGITLLEKLLYPKGSSPRRHLAAGTVLAAAIPLLSFAASLGILLLAGMLHPVLRLGVETLFCFQIFATRNLRDETMNVSRCLDAGDLPGARQAVARIVGRDTERLDRAGTIRAAVETVAENTTDGVVAPLFFLMIGGAPLGFLYKAVNTLDSMVGYKNDRYLYFGRPSARLDDACNFLPARLTALAIVLVSAPLGLDGKGAWRVFRRDRKAHTSPNSAQTESACAGALGIRLGGRSTYGGVPSEKPWLGDFSREPVPGDIARANRLLYASSLLCLLLLAAIRLAVSAILYGRG